MSVRRPIYTNGANDRPKDEDTVLRLSHPVPPPCSITNVFLTLILQFCRKVLFFKITLRIAVYVISLFVISVITDALPVPKTYFSNTDNILNFYFVKFGWFWTLVISIPFVGLTSYTYCCGRREFVIRHMFRLLIATANWYIFVSLFNYIEGNYGTCKEKREIKYKDQCKLHGYNWSGLDISGHAFILIYSTLVLIEEARCVIGWESLQDLIRKESYWRVNPLRPYSPLHDLSNSEFIQLHTLYCKTLPYVRILFISLTVFTLIWDAMLLTTIFYFHSMPEKLFGGLVAISAWFVTYHVWYKIPSIPPLLPGEGLFKYNIPNETKRNDSSVRRNSVPSFMGMRLNVPSNEIS